MTVIGNWNQLVKWKDPRSPCDVDPSSQPEMASTLSICGLWEQKLRNMGDVQRKTSSVLNIGPIAYDLAVSPIFKQGYVLNSVKCQMACEYLSPELQKRCICKYHRLKECNTK